MVKRVYVKKKPGFDVENSDIKSPVAELGGKSIGETLLTPTKIYVKPVLALLEKVNVKGISHITGGGFYENMPRMLRDGVALNIDVNSYTKKPIFDLIQKTGNILTRDMYNTFNMGIGMAIIVPANEVEKALEVLKAQGEEAYLIGEVVEGNKEINLNI